MIGTTYLWVLRPGPLPNSPPSWMAIFALIGCFTLSSASWNSTLFCGFSLIILRLSSIPAPTTLLIAESRCGNNL